VGGAMTYHKTEEEYLLEKEYLTRYVNNKRLILESFDDIILLISHLHKNEVDCIWELDILPSAPFYLRFIDGSLITIRLNCLNKGYKIKNFNFNYDLRIDELEYSSKTSLTKSVKRLFGEIFSKIENRLSQIEENLVEIRPVKKGTLDNSEMLVVCFSDGIKIPVKGIRHIGERLYYTLRVPTEPEEKEYSHRYNTNYEIMEQVELVVKGFAYVTWNAEDFLVRRYVEMGHTPEKVKKLVKRNFDLNDAVMRR
jgi:hypothetical protein